MGWLLYFQSYDDCDYCGDCGYDIDHKIDENYDDCDCWWLWLWCWSLDQMFKSSNLQMLKCSNVQMFKCSNVQMFQCSKVPKFQYSNGKMLKC